MAGEKGQNSLQSKRHNRGLVLRRILTGACSSRVELARATGLSKMTVTNIVAGLIAQGLVEECEEFQTAACGRSPIGLRLAKGAPRAAGLFIGRDRVQGVLCTLTLEELKREEVSFRSLEKDRVPIYACEVLDRLLAGESGVLGIGAAYGAPAELRDFLEERYRLPVLEDQDCAAAALAESLFGAGQGVGDLLCLELGDQIGAGIVCGGAVCRGSRRLPARMGHVCIDRNGPPCSCGGRGCLEMYAGTRVVTGRLCRATGLRLRFAQFCRLSGVAEIETIMGELARDLAAGLSGPVELFHPEMIVLGGDGIDWGDRHIRLLEEALSRGGEAIPVRRARFGKEAALMGAAANVVSALFRGEL